MTQRGIPADWAEILQIFFPDLRDALGVLARRLDVVVSQVRARPRPRGDDPDGFAGITRKGPLDRLLLSEWAIADAVPEEFDRRATSGEQMFLQLDRREPARSVRTVALFDGGPDQLGGPRVVQLALLLVLWRRAQAAGAELAWGMLQSDGPLATSVDPATIRAFLAGRTGSVADASRMRGGARERLGKAWDELWLVGGPGLGALDPSAWHVEIGEVLSATSRQVDAKLRRNGSLVGEARLDLPADADGRRLLTDPFPPPAPVRPPWAATPPPNDGETWKAFPRGGRDPTFVRFIPGTQQLLVLLRTGHAFTWSFPLDGSAPVEKPTMHLPWRFDVLIAAGFAHQAALRVKLREQPSGGRPPAVIVGPHGDVPLPAIEGGPPAPGAGSVVNGGGVMAFTDGARRLFLVRRGAGGRALGLERLDLDVRGLFPVNGRIWCVHVRDGRTVVGRLTTAGVEEAKVHDGVFLTAGMDRWRPVMALRGDDGVRFVPIEPLAPTEATPAVCPLPAAGETVLGVGLGRRQTPTLLLWDGKRVLHPGTDVSVFPDRGAADVSVSPTGTEVAWHTNDGFLRVFSLVTGRPLLQRHGS